MINPYQILGVHKASHPQEIKERYYALMKQEHPDAGGTQANAADITAAYKILTDRGMLSQHLDEMSILGAPCGACGGKGFKHKQKGLTERILTACAACGGQGATRRNK